MKIFTSRFSHQIPDELQAVGIAIGEPKWRLPYSVVYYKKIAPYGSFGIEDEREFKKSYFRQLNKIGFENIKSDLEQLSKQFGDKDLVLLCYENTAHDWCHRTHFSQWWEANTGELLPELEVIEQMEKDKDKWEQLDLF